MHVPLIKLIYLKTGSSNVFQELRVQVSGSILFAMETFFFLNKGRKIH